MGEQDVGHLVGKRQLRHRLVVVRQREHALKAAHELDQVATTVEQVGVLDVQHIKVGGENRLGVEVEGMVWVPQLDVEARRLADLEWAHVTLAVVA